MSDLPFAIQLVTPDTASLLDNVDEDVFDHPVSTVYLREFLDNASCALFVATIEGQVVGMATGMTYVHPDKPKSLFIIELGVAATHHRRGIGSRLMDSMLGWGKDRGCVEAWVATEVENSVAQSFYAATGGIQDDTPSILYVYSLATGSTQRGDT